jgi:F1F0 ATPase subunit 2
MMNEFVLLLLAGLGGLALGIIFFGGLWWTVQKKLPSRRAALWFLGSLILRTALVLAGFYLISQRDWRNLLACLLGFFAGKIAVLLWTRKKGGQPCA